MFRDPNFARRVPPHFKVRYEKVHATRVANMKPARRCGVRMAMGTDAGTPGNHCGNNMQELEVMVEEAGFPHAEAIHAATLGAADLMGLAGDLGSLEEGKIADIIATKADPLKNVAALRQVGFVMKAGRVYKQNGVPVPFV
jgi:imidazolonepropionase-like amidohydrolase